MPSKTAKQFPERFLKAIRPGADLSLVTARFIVWLMNDLQQHVRQYPGVLKALEAVQAVYERVVQGETVTDAEWSAAAKVEKWACADGAHLETFWINESAMRAWHAAEAAEYAVRAATDSKCSARAAEAAACATSTKRFTVDSRMYELMADMLIELLQDAPVQEAT